MQQIQTQPLSSSAPLAWRPLQRSTRVMILVALAATVAYLLFLLAPGNRGTTWLWLVTLAAECLAAVHAFGTWWTILAHDDHPESGDVVVRRHQLVSDPGSAPPIDVLITACGEPDDLVLRTAIAARDMRLAHRTFVLDDGRSEPLAAQCAAHGIGYLRRPGREDAKAGNVNAALAQTDGEFVLILDADHLPVPDFLTQVLPHFVDPSVALVQAPQSYYEGGGIIGAGASEAQRIFYELVCPGKNKFNAAFCVGTNVVFRRIALDDIGGIHTGSNSEDIWTSLDLHRRGWRSVYVPQVLATGLAPDTIGAFVKQQHRWASGGFEIVTRGRLLRRDRKLTVDQRLQYGFVGTHYLLSVAMLIFMCLPAMYLMFGLSPIRASGWDWASHYLPFYVATLAVTWLQSGGFRLSAIVTSIAAAPVHLRAFIGVAIGRTTSWTVTNSAKRRASSLWPVMPHVFLICLNACAIVVGLSVFTSPAPTLLSVGWASVHIALLGRVVFEAVRPGPRPSARPIVVAPRRSPTAARIAAFGAAIVRMPLTDRGKILVPTLAVGLASMIVALTVWPQTDGSASPTDRAAASTGPSATAPAITPRPSSLLALSAEATTAPTVPPLEVPTASPIIPTQSSATQATPRPTRVVLVPVKPAVQPAPTPSSTPTTAAPPPAPSSAPTPSPPDTDATATDTPSDSPVASTTHRRPN